jgi:hypothetical protein
VQAYKSGLLRALAMAAAICIVADSAAKVADATPTPSSTSIIPASLRRDATDVRIDAFTMYLMRRAERKIGSALEAPSRCD